MKQNLIFIDFTVEQAIDFFMKMSPSTWMDTPQVIKKRDSRMWWKPHDEVWIRCICLSVSF